MNHHLDIVWTTQFKKDYKLAIKRHLDIGLLDEIIRKLASARIDIISNGNTQRSVRKVRTSYLI